MILKRLFPAAAVLLLSACDLSGSVESLLMPPLVSEDQEAVYNALMEDTGSNISLVYPRTGDNRSAFIFRDLDGDGSSEAVAFYRSGGESNNVRVNILSQGEQGWHSVYDHSGSGSSIERVFFSPFSGGTDYLCIGYAYTNRSDKLFSVYSYKNGVLENEYSDIYYRLEQTDINMDGSDDVLLVEGNTEEHPAYVVLVTDLADGLGVRALSGAAMRTNTTELLSTAVGGIAGGHNALFVDSSSAGGITTEIIYSVDGMLRNPAALEDSQIPSLTQRRSLYSMDIDGDGIVEIPTSEPFPGYRENDSQVMTIWNSFEDYDIVPKYWSLYVPQQNYCFMLPVRWKGLVTVKTDASTGERVFYKFNSSLSQSRLELMRIASIDAADDEEYRENGYVTIVKNEKACIMALFPTTDDPLVLTQTEAANGMIVVED